MMWMFKVVEIKAPVVKQVKSNDCCFILMVCVIRKENEGKRMSL